MKTIEEIKNEVAKKHGYTGLCKPNSKLDTLVNEAMQEYAKQCCDEQIKACAENAEAERDQCYDGGGHCGFPIVDKDSILSTPNVAEKP